MPVPPLDLSRPIPLFPLPNCVLFPGTVQPLHIFEPRYRAMLEDVLEEGRVLAMALLRPGWQAQYYGAPAVYPLVCVGRVVAHERLPDGKFNLLLHGVARTRIVSEQKRGLYRVALMEPVPEGRVAAGAAQREAAQRALLRELFKQTALGTLTVAPTLLSMFDEGLPHGKLVDALAFGLVQEVPAKQLLLEETDPLVRGEMLLRNLVALAGNLGPVATPPAKAVWGPAGGEWPPGASNN